MPLFVTGSMLYNLVQCPHRVHLDQYGDVAQRDPVDEFVQLLWERGNTYEREVVDNLDEEFVDLTVYHGDEREAKTREAMATGAPLIYSARLSHGDLLGEPDLLRKEGNGYLAGDIKSGAGYEGVVDDGEGKPKKHYAVQLAIYTDILQSLGMAVPGHRAFVWDIHGDTVEYALDDAQGPRTPETWWEVYERVKAEALAIVNVHRQTLPALASICGLCHWKSLCRRQLEASHDLSLIPELGRSKRDTLIEQFSTVADMANANLNDFCDKKGKTIFPGIGLSSLQKFQDRAQLQIQTNPVPYFKSTVTLPSSDKELFFDIENDPMAGICYLHGFVSREGGDDATERFHGFMMNDGSPQEEERVFAEALDFIRSFDPTAVYIYSKYERTMWRQLAEKYPRIASLVEIDELFGQEYMVDLYYDVVNKHMVWPTRNHSIKTLAQHLGFSWRDDHPSGAASIKWYQDMCRTGDLTIRQRILDYNEDDCRAMKVLVDYLKKI